MAPPEKHKPRADLKVVIVGERSVGKTCFIHRYTERTFTTTYSTIGAAFALKLWKGYNIAIWDTAGEERFAGLSSHYCRGAGAAILAFDPNDEETFKILTQRYIPLLEAADDDCLKVVIATKSDLMTPNSRKVSAEAGRLLAHSLNPTNKNVPYFETSSRLGTNVDEAFEFIFTHCLEIAIGRPREETLILEEPLQTDERHRRKNCCD